MNKAQQAGVLGLAALAGLVTATALPLPSTSTPSAATIYATAFEATPQPAALDTLLVTKAGVWTLTMTADGIPALAPYSGQVIRLDGGTAPGPDPTPDPTTPLESHRKAVQAATAAVVDPNKKNTQAALSKLYATTAGLPVTSTDQLKTATNTIFGALGLPHWGQWKVAVDKSLASFTALDDARKAWMIVAEVLEQP